MKYLLNVIVAVALLGAPAAADVTAHGDDGVPGRPVVILQLSIVDSGDPINVAAERGEAIELLTDGSEPVHSLTDDGDPVHTVWRQHLDPTQWHRSLNVHGFDRNDDRPAIVVSAGRVPYAAWARASASGYDLVASRFVDGAWTGPVVVSTHAGHELGASLAVDSTGVLHLAYWVFDRGQARVEYRTAGPGGDSWSAPTVVSTPTEIAVRPSIAAAAGRVSIAYESHIAGFGSTPRHIVVAENVDGEWSTDVVATTTHDAPNRPGIHAAAGRVWMEWIDGDDRMNWTRREPDGRWAPLAAEPFTDVEDRDYHARGRIKAAALPDNDPD